MSLRRRLVVLPPYLWLVALFAIPFAIVLRISLSDAALAIPPYTPQWDAGGGWAALREMLAGLDAENFLFLLEDQLYWRAYLSSVRIAAVSTLLALLVGYPVALAIARADEAWRPTLLMLVILPFWTSFLIRVYAWIGILGTDGYLNQALLGLGVIAAPVQILNTDWAVFVGIVYTYCPFMILPIYATLEKLDGSLLEAAEDLGCSRASAFWHVTAPLSRPGVIAGCFLVFIPAVGEYVIPTLLGGSDTLMIGAVLYQEFFSNRDWPVASAVAVVLLLILVVPIVLYQRTEARRLEADE